MMEYNSCLKKHTNSTSVGLTKIPRSELTCFNQYLQTYSNRVHIIYILVRFFLITNVNYKVYKELTYLKIGGK